MLPRHRSVVVVGECPVIFLVLGCGQQLTPVCLIVVNGEVGQDLDTCMPVICGLVAVHSGEVFRGQHADAYGQRHRTPLGDQVLELVQDEGVERRDGVAHQ